MRQVNGLWLPDDDTHFERYALAGSYQQPVYTQAVSFVRERSWALDVGAHVGFWSRVMAADFKRVDAFEPIPDNLECLRANVPATVNVHAMALGHSSGRLSLHTGSRSNSGAWEQSSREAGDGIAYADVHPLDEFRLWTRGVVDLVKIDVQGMEFAVLAGARETLLRAKPVIVVEVVCHGQFDATSLTLLHELGATRIGAYKADWIFGWPTS